MMDTTTAETESTKTLKTEQNRPPFRAVVSADLFKRAQIGVSKEHFRYYLNGVFVTPCKDGGALLLATDGHMLICIRDPRGIVEGSGIIALNKQLLGMLSEKRDDVTSRYGAHTERVVAVQRDGHPFDAVAIVAFSSKTFRAKGDEVDTELRPEIFGILGKLDKTILGYQTQDAVIDGTFPDWKRVVPKNLFPDNPSGIFNPFLIERAAQALCSSVGEGLLITPSGSRAEPHYATSYYSKIDGFAVLMPMRAPKNKLKISDYAL